MIDQTTYYHGVTQASLAGGTIIMFSGQPMSMYPSDMTVVYTGYDINFKGDGAPLTQANVFKSSTKLGLIQYTTPSVMELHGLPYEAFGALNEITYSLGLRDFDSTNQDLNMLNCASSSSTCRISVSRGYTPILYGLSPQIVYDGSLTSLWVDPRSAQGIRTIDKMPFYEARIDGYALNFDGFVNINTVYLGFQPNQIRATVGEVLPNNSSYPNIQFISGYAMHMDSQMTRCDYTNTTCYKVRSVGVINSISQSQGYTTGGQLVTVQGYGFQTGLINATIDGVKCAVQSQTLKSFTCLTGHQNSPSNNHFYAGQHGFRRKYYNTSQPLNFENITASQAYTETLAPDLEAPINLRNGWSGNVYSGYFKAPATAQYRFYIACDDGCMVFLSNGTDPNQKQLIFTSTQNGYRDYFRADGSTKTSWLNFTKDELYYIEARHIQAGGNDDVTVSLEIFDPNVIPGHQQSMRQIQRLLIYQHLVRDQLNITVTNPDSGQFVLKFVIPNSGGQLWTSQPINANTGIWGTWEFNGFGNFYYTYWGAPYQVFATLYDINGQVTKNQSQIHSIVYTINMLASIIGVSTTNVYVQKISTASTITVTLPSQGQKSSPPLSGAFQIQCTLQDGVTQNTTDNIPVQSSPAQIGAYLMAACPNYVDKFQIWNGPTFQNYNDGRELLVRFVNLNQDVPLMQLLSSTKSPLGGNQVNQNVSIFVPYSQQNLFYEPVPFEFVHTNETSPQVIVSIDGIPAVCASLNCNYNYIQPIASITGYTLSGQTLTITGTNLPTKIVTLSLSNIPCTNIQSQGTTSITCSVVPVAGNWQPVLLDSFGIIPIVPVTTIAVPLTITSVSPNSALNPSGSQTLVIIGLNLPQSTTDGTSVSITFTGGSSCIISQTSSTQIKCVTQAFAAGVTSAVMTVSINGLNDSSQTIQVTSSPAQVVSISPSAVSPVLKNVVNLTISGFQSNLIISDLSVAFNLFTGSLYTTAINYNPLYVNILSLAADNNGNQIISVMFGGSPSGVYNVSVVSQTYGKFDATTVSIQTIGVVTSFYPQSGSVFGGTLITINGQFFSSDPHDNPVMIGYSDCLVQTSSANQITCITTPRLSGTDGMDDFMVFLKTYEQAVCNAATCQYTWILGALPTLNSYSVNYNTSLNDYVLTLDGVGFGANMTNTEVYIDNAIQPLLSASDTEVNVQIASMLNNFTLNVDFYLPIGVPQGTDSLTLTQGITLTPQFLSFTPNVGSPAGSTIIATVKGLGPLTQGVTLLDQNGVSVCSIVSIYAYGIVQCQSKQQTYPLQQLSVSVGGSTYACQDQTGLCNYQTSTSMPYVSSLAISSTTTMTFTGSGFSISGFLPFVTFNQIQADSVSVINDTSAIATFNNGVPLSQTAQRPVLYFQNTTSNITHWANIHATLANANQVSAVASPISCSFAGECNLVVNSPGLLSTLSQNPAQNQLLVCSQPCQPNIQLSTASTFVCSVPSLPTSFSIQNFNVSTETSILGQTFSSLNQQQTGYLFDGVLTNGWNSNGGNCYFGTSFLPGYVGILRQVKYFMNQFYAPYFIGNLHFQGSSDGVNYTTIFTVGKEIHQGWNYYNYPAGQEPRYRYYRFFGSAYGSCTLGEVVFSGFEAIDSSSNSYSCGVQLNLNGAVIPLSGNVTYQASLTPLLTSISPRFGNVRGGDSVTFTGQNFSPDQSAYTILIDNRTCIVTAATSTSVTCTTAKRPGLYPDTSLDIQIAGKGGVATQGLVFRYCSLWSDPTTWGGEYTPITGDMVVIPPGLHLLVDIDSTPVLSAVLVEGSLIFPPHSDPNHVRTFDAHYVFVDGGYMEVGTEEFPYTSKLIITMWSNKTSPEIPTYGNKVIAVMNGILEMHGIPRNPTWTEMAVTSLAGSNQITLMTPVDWKAGEVIVIASTDYDHTNSEQMTIASVDNTNPNNPVITLTQPLANKHYSGRLTFGQNGDFIEMRAEVGLLTRNVVYRGDPGTSAVNKFGAHIMLHSPGDESLIGRIEYIEFTDVGQAFQLGRYPIHFHLIGTVINSYVRGNAIHQTYNRAVTFHGVFYLTVEDNVAYNTMGHTFFVEDAIEENNLIQNNLAISTYRSYSLLMSDQFPASFWITNPNNILRGNHAAGSDNWGFWFDPKQNPTGPSYTTTICPNHNPLGEFSNNVAHSNGQYGLRIWRTYVPLTYPCQPKIYDPTNTTDPYWQNPLVIANFTNFTSYKNLENGALTSDVGGINLVNFKVADNFICGIEFELANETMDGTTNLNGAVVIGYTENAEVATNTTNSFGIITARSENFQVHNVHFYNFDVGDKAAIGSCSHCFFADSADSGARTIIFSGLYFDDNTVPLRIRYQYPWKDIFYDLDGTLTGLGPKTWATPYYKHNDQKECTLNFDKFDGLICDSTIQVRRIVFWNFMPTTLAGMDLKILKYDDDYFGVMDNATQQAYIQNSNNYGLILFTPIGEPGLCWAVPMITSYKYKFHWEYGLDFLNMEVSLSPRWLPTDYGVDMLFNFTDVRAAVVINAGGTIIPNNTLAIPKAQWHQGDNVVLNDTATRTIELYLDGSNASMSNITMGGFRCIGPCLANIATVTLNSTILLWSDPKSWPNGVLPAAGDKIVINETQNFVYDLVDSPIYNYIEINGALTFLQTAPRLSLRAYYIFVRAGQFNIGNSTNPFPGDANITLYGMLNQETIVYTNAIEAGNKVFANTARVSMFGKQRSQISRLYQTAMPNDTTVWVSPGLDWNVNDRLGFAATRMFYYEQDYALISSYNNVTGQLILQTPLQHYHYGANQSTAAEYSGVDIRGEVLLLSRHITIAGNDTERWGCQVLTGDFVEGDGTFRNGSTIMDSVEIYNCSQYDTMNGAMRFESVGNSYSQITNCAIHHGYGIGIDFQDAANILLQNSTVFSFIKFGINIVSSRNITLDGNIVAAVYSRNYNFTVLGDIMGGILACGANFWDYCPNVKLINNIVIGVQNAGGDDSVGFVVQAHECGDYSNIVFKNNTAHSIQGYGAQIFKNEFSPTQANCMEASHFVAYKCTLAGVGSYTTTNEIIFSNMVLIDNVWSAVPFIGQDGDVLWARMKNVIFYGETEAHDCPAQGYCTGQTLNDCFDRTAIMMSQFSIQGKPPMNTLMPHCPQFNVKATASFGGNIQYDNITFANFAATTYCGNTQYLFQLASLMMGTGAPDYQPELVLTNTHFINVDQGAVVYIMTPPNLWVAPDHCGDFACTGPNNVLFTFTGSTFSGTVTPQYTEPNFQIISANTQNSGVFKGCTPVAEWNAYYCNQGGLAILLFQSLDADYFSRIFSPVYITGVNNGARNVLNTFSDHTWDGFYAGQIRYSRFPALIQMGNNYVYNISYTGTPPSAQEFSLRKTPGSVIVRIQYPKTGAYIIQDYYGKTIPANAWDNSIGAPGAIKGDNGGSCGENRYVGVVNILEFYLKNGCNITIHPIDSIQLQVRLNWTLASFYSSGGTTQFTDRLAASLAIQPQQIKIVSVYEGSVVAITQISALNNTNSTNSSAGNLTSIQEILVSKLNSNTINLGAPILSVNIQTTSPNASTVASSVPVSYTNPQYTAAPVPVVITQPVNQATPQQQKTVPTTVITQSGSVTTQQSTSVTTVIITQQEVPQSTNTVTIAVICVIIGLVILSGITTFVLYRRFKMRQTIGMKVDSKSGSSVSANQEEVFEDQYHPNAGFDIFGKDDLFKKANAADSVAEDECNSQQVHTEEGVQHTSNRETHQLDNDPLNRISSIEQSTHKMLSVSQLDEELGVKRS